jgi:hypothetical protein
VPVQDDDEQCQSHGELWEEMWYVMVKPKLIRCSVRASKLASWRCEEKRRRYYSQSHTSTWIAE